MISQQGPSRVCHGIKRFGLDLSFGANQLQPLSQTAAQKRLAFGSVNIRALLRIKVTGRKG
jgi:hypothetical protein